MKKRYWLNRLKPSSYLLSDYANRARLEERYVQPSGLTFIDTVDLEEVETEVVESSVNVQVDCCVSLGGVQCGVEAGFVKVISGNEPTEPLKNIKKPFMLALFRVFRCYRMIPSTEDGLILLNFE